MLSELLEVLMPDDSTATDRAVFILSEWTAGGWILAAIDWLVAGKQPIAMSLLFLSFAIVFAVFGVEWPSIKTKFVPGSRFVSRIETVATDYRYRTAGAILLTLVAVVVLSLYLHSLRQDIDTYLVPRHVTERGCPSFS